jgi:hypothetical protein
VTDNMFLAHIFRQRMRGSREEAKIRFFNLDGSPADFSESGSQGGSAEQFVYYGGSSISILNNPGADVDTPGTFGDNWLEYVKGFDVDPGDETLQAQEGAYFAQMGLTFNYEGTVDPGWLTVSLNMAYTDGNGNPASTDVITVEVHYDHGTTGVGDASFTDFPILKNIVSIIPADAELSLLVSQHGVELAMSILINLILVKL